MNTARPILWARMDRAFPFPCFFLDPGQELLSARRMAEEEHSGFREGPLQVDVAHLGTAGAVGLPSGLVRTLDQPGVGGEFLDAIERVMS